MGEISQIFQCSFTLFVSKSNEHRFNAVLTAFYKKSGMPTYTGQKFQNKTRFYLHFFNLSVGLLFSKKKIAFRNFKNSLMLIYTFRFDKRKNEIFAIIKNGKNKIGIAPQLVELPQCAFLKLLKLRNAIFNTSNEVPITSYLKVDKT